MLTALLVLALGGSAAIAGEPEVTPVAMSAPDSASANPTATPFPEELVNRYIEYRRLLDERTAKGFGPPAIREGEYRSAGRMEELENYFRKAVPENQEWLVRLLRESDLPDRQMACLLLGYTKNKQDAVAALMLGLADPSHAVHEEAGRTLFALASLPQVDIPVDHVTPLLTHSSWMCRNRALAILETLVARKGPDFIHDDEHLAATLVGLLLSPHYNVRRPALALLRRASGQWHGASPHEWRSWYSDTFHDDLPEVRKTQFAKSIRIVPVGSGKPPLIFLDAVRCRHGDEVEGRLRLWVDQLHALYGKEIQVEAFLVARSDLDFDLFSRMTAHATSSGVDDVVTYSRGATDVDGTLVVDPVAGRAVTVDESIVQEFSDYQGALASAVAGATPGAAHVRAGEWSSDGRAGEIEKRFRKAATEQQETLLAFLAYGAPVQREMAACILGWCPEKKQVLPAFLRALAADPQAHAVHQWVGWHLYAWASIPGIEIPASAALALAGHTEAGCRGRAVALAERLVAMRGGNADMSFRQSICKAIVLACRDGATPEVEKRLLPLLTRLGGGIPGEDAKTWKEWFRSAFRTEL